MTDETHENGTSDWPEWNDDRRSPLEELRVTSREPSSHLRVRTLAVLHDRGLVMPNDAARRLVKRPPPRSFGRPFAIAAAVTLAFVGGGAAGYRLALSRVAARSGQSSLRVAAGSTPPVTVATQRTAERHVVWF